MRRANYTVVKEDSQRLIIMDVGPWDKHLTVTNDAENVVRDLAARLGSRRLYYHDSEGTLGEIEVKDGAFQRFKGVYG